ncbi:unnamed protein product, partial [Musa textilis]
MGGGIFSETGRAAETPSRPRQSLENISEPILDDYNALTIISVVFAAPRRAPTLIQGSSVVGAPIHPPAYPARGSPPVFPPGDGGGGGDE